jgi:hypothetical protein
MTDLSATNRRERLILLGQTRVPAPLDFLNYTTGTQRETLQFHYNYSD